jgi:uncharacterized protein involved in outer membrane biogenesis
MRRLLLVLGGIPALLVLLLLGALAAVSTAPVRARIAGALSDALGQPVAIGGLHVSLLPSPALAASEVRIGDADPKAAADSTAAPGLFVPELRAVPELASLLPGRPIVVKSVELTRAVIAVRRDSTGSLVLPAMPAPGADSSAARTGGRSVALNQLELKDGTLRIVDDRLRDARGQPTVASVRSIGATLHASGGRVVIPRFSGKVGSTDVNGAMQMGADGAELRLAIPSVGAADLPELFALAGMEPNHTLAISGKAPLTMTITAPKTPESDRKTEKRGSRTATAVVTGKTSIEHVRLGKVPLDGLATTFRYAKGVLTLDPLAFSTYGGREQGSATVDVNGKASTYAVRTTISGLDVGAALAGMTQVKDKLTGSAKVTANVTGAGSDAAAVERSLAGTVQLDMVNGIIHGMPILARLNSALGASAGGAAAKSDDTPFQALHGTARIANGRAQLTNLHVTTGEVNLAGSGTVGFDHTVDLSLVAQLSAAAANAAAASLGGITSRLGDVVEHLQSSHGTIAVPVTVTGTLAAPKIGVDVGALAKAQVQNQLRQQVERLMGVSREDSVQGVRGDSANAPPNPVAGIVQGLQQLLQKH